MTYNTDERLKSYLDTNQQHREQMCLAVLALDKRFTEVRPRHPRGGPDGGRDIEAIYRREHTAYGAVGFVNQAADVEEKKKTIRGKFTDDVGVAWAAIPRPSVFIFFCNVNFTIGEKASLVAEAKTAGFLECEIFDRERIRISLDTADGFAARFQYLGLPMSEAEQASFFAKWGDEINSVISTGFQQVHNTLAHLLFLHEANKPITGFHVQFQLDREYAAKEIGHFRAFCWVLLREPKLKILQLIFGSSDKANRFRPDVEAKASPSGISHGIGSGQWHIPFDPENSANTVDVPEEYVQSGSSSSIGKDAVRTLVCSYTTGSFIRFEPVLSLADFEDAMFTPLLSHSLANKVSRITVYANGYLLLDLPKDKFRIDSSPFEEDMLSASFDAIELGDPWVRLRPAEFSSSFRFTFSSEVPMRMFVSRQASNDQQV